jgi:hypothetical protein
MNNNAWFKKEIPLQTVIGLGGGATGFQYHSSASKTYVDEVFNTFAYIGNATGTGTDNQIVNGIDNSTKGGMVWIKNRTQNVSSLVFDTIRGGQVEVKSDSNAAQAGPYTDYNIKTFNTDGFTLTGNGGNTNENTKPYAAWNFRNQKGFFDVVQYTGDGTASQTINHSLGSIPGVIIARRTDSWGTWVVYHRSLGNDNILYLDTNDAQTTNADQFDQTDPTSSSFTVEATGTGASDLNVNSATYIAYLFAGGESTAATATSVYTESSGYLGLDQSTDFDLGTSDFTIEAWVRPRTGDRSGSTFNILSFGYPFNLYYVADASVPYSGKFTWDGSTSNSTNNQTMGGYTPANSVEQNQWNHVALTRSGSTFKFFLNGTLAHTGTSSSAFGTNAVHGCKIGYGTPAGTQYFQGDVSNLRYVLGTALYTDSFKVPTEPLSNVTNTKLLCCQGSANDSATVSPGSITAYNSPSWKAYSPFDDPDGFKFGAEGDQNIIKCGSYKGNASSNGPEINLGWEPQWILLKRVAGGTGSWAMFDNIRGIVSGGDDPVYQPDVNDAEYTTTQYLDVTPTGFELKGNFNQSNASGDTYIYIAIRRPDGYVGKPAEAGTDVFTMDYGNARTVIPAFDSNFPVDFGLQKTVASVTDWAAVTRLMGPKELNTNDTSAEASGSAYVWDSNLGYTAASWADSGMLSWMWKRHAGFDVITTDISLTAGDPISHNLGVVPEMIIGKPRDSSYAGEAWNVYHKGLNGGTNPEQYRIRLNTADGESSDSAQSWYDTAPTATHFRIGANFSSDRNPLFLLFASVEGISKVGYYSGNSSSNTITTGFQPRFVFIKRTNDTGSWMVHDTVRGFTAGDDPYLRFNSDAAQSNFGVGTVISTGFIVSTTDSSYNESGSNYLYYAHA